ncbi:MAG: Spy/CpxP family protein refolding chaperone [Legionella sp.]|uniref:Spy/CpxP family protein refolding chaperone n=1 Tax=Legionella sp. TaxID=459 RepID=UPI0039E6F9D1
MYKKLLGTLALACSLVFGSTAMAHAFGCGEGMDKMVQSLNLDDSQKQKVKPIIDSLKTSMQQNREQMKDLSKQINAQVTSPNMDQSAVNDLVDKKVKMIGDIIKAKINAKSQIFAVLNDQQKAQFKDMMKKMHDKMEAQFKSCHEQAQE